MSPCGAIGAAISRVSIMAIPVFVDRDGGLVQHVAQVQPGPSSLNAWCTHSSRTAGMYHSAW
jgi:hypothetical protein